MARTHVYILSENLALTDAEYSIIVDDLRALGPGGGEPMPHLRNHWSTRLDGKADIFEANFESLNITLVQFKQYMADASGVSTSVIDDTTQDILQGRLFTYSRAGTERFSILLFGGLGASIKVSRDEARKYLIDNKIWWDPTVGIGPLDKVPGAEAAYSIARRLTSVSWGTVDGMLDPMVRLIRSSDSVEMTFSYGSNNELDTAAIVTFLGGASGDVVKIYDQTGNGFHRDQATDTKRPLYVTSGIGSKPSNDFDRSASQHLGGVSTGTSIPFTLYTVFRADVTFAVGVLVGSHSAARMLFTFLDSDRLQVRPVSVITNFNISALSLSTDYVGVLKRDASENLLFFENGTNTTVGSPSSSEATGIGDIGSRQGGGIHYDGLFSELLFYKVDHSPAERTTIEDNIGAFYGIPISSVVA